MLGRIKETLKKWLVEHERLYWYIVVGLAVFLFGLITAMGMAKLEKANAAENIWYPDLKKVDFSGCQYDWASIIETYEHCAVGYKPSDDTYYFAFCDEELYATDNPGSGWNVFDFHYRPQSWHSIVGFSYGIYITANYEVVNELKLCSFDFNSNDYVQGCDLIGTTFTIIPQANKDYPGESEAYVATLPQNNIVHPREYVEPAVLKEPFFFSGGPYLRLKDDYYYNVPYTITTHDDESVAGVPILGDCPVASWKWIYKGSIGGFLKDYEGEDTSIVSNTKAQITLDVGIPSRAWVSDCIENMELVSELRALRTEEKRYEWVNTRFKNGKMEDCIVSFSSNLDVTSDSKDFELTFYYTDMLEKVREVLSIEDWAEYYGVTDVQWDEFWSHIVFGYLTVNQMDSIVFNQYTDTDIMYGCYVSDVFTSGYNYSGYVYQDFFADPQACISAMNTELQEAYETVIAESNKKLEEYEAELEVINKELEMLRADDTALFDIFTGLANSLKNATVGLRSLSVAIGNIFAFLPPEILLCYNFAFCAILFISIVKALRG